MSAGGQEDCVRVYACLCGQGAVWGCARSLQMRQHEGTCFRRSTLAGPGLQVAMPS